MIKRCAKCKQWKQVTEFGKCAANKDGLQARCRPCHNASVRESTAKHLEASRQRVRDYRLRKPDIIARNALRQCARQWGLDPNEVEARFNEHNGRCDICGLTATESCATRNRLGMDHDHSVVGVFRGFLCHGCNAGLGGFQDDPVLLVAAIQYLADSAAKIAGAT